MPDGPCLQYGKARCSLALAFEATVRFSVGHNSNLQYIFIFFRYMFTFSKRNIDLQD